MRAVVTTIQSLILLALCVVLYQACRWIGGARG